MCPPVGCGGWAVCPHPFGSSSFILDQLNSTSFSFFTEKQIRLSHCSATCMVLARAGCRMHGAIYDMYVLAIPSDTCGKSQHLLSVIVIAPPCIQCSYSLLTCQKKGRKSIRKCRNILLYNLRYGALSSPVNEISPI